MRGIKTSLIVALSLTNTFADVLMLDEVMVSSTSLGQKQLITDVQASVQVLDQKAIKSTSGRTVAQVLNEAVGLNVKDGGSSTQISMRGFNNTHTLILVDGLRRTGKYGNSDVSGISLEDIERIEIIRGPMSALYGADAVGGIVNIITKEASKGTTAKVSVLGGIADNGERETGIVRTTVNVGGETLSHTISAEATERGAYREDQESVGTDLRRESHQFVSYGNAVKLGDDTLRTRLEFVRQDDHGVSGAGVDTHEKEKRYQASAIYNHVSNNYHLNTNLGYGYSDTNVNRSGTDELTKYGQGEINVFLHHFTSDDVLNIIGIGGRYEDIDVTMYSKTAERINFNLLYQNEWRITNNLSTVAGVRYDRFSDFGSTTNPRVSAKYDIYNGYFRASYGEAFKAPSFTDMYGSFVRSAGPTTSYIDGNPNLNPETSKTYEVATGYAVGKSFTLDLMYHHTRFDDLIASYIATSAHPNYYYSKKNINKATIEGIELSTAYRPMDALGIIASVEYLDTKDETTGTRLIDSAQYTAKVRLSYKHAKTEYFLNFKAMRDYYGATEVRNVYANYDYHTIDIKVTHAWNQALELSLGVDNIQNNIPGYGLRLFGTPNDPGERYYYVGVTAKF